MYGSSVNWMWNESTIFFLKYYYFLGPVLWENVTLLRSVDDVLHPPPSPPPRWKRRHTPPFATVVRSVGHGNFKALQLTNDCTTKLGPRDHHRPSPTTNAHCVRQRPPGTYYMNPSREQRPVDQAYPPPPPPPVLTILYPRQANFTDCP